MSNLLDQDKGTHHKDRSESARRLKSGFAVILSLVVLIGGGFFAVSKVGSTVSGFFVADDYPGPGEGEVEVVIPTGATIDEIGSILHDAEVVKSSEAFAQAAAETPNSNRLQAGIYTLRKEMRASDAIGAMLEAGVKGGKRFLIREGLRLNEQVAELARQTGIPEDRYREVLADPQSFGLPAIADGKPEGFLFPDTYEMSGEDPAAALKQMTANFQRKATEVQLEARANEMNRDPRDLVTVASIIEAEVQRPEDQVKVARVIYNRLDAKPTMRLQMDSTVGYAVNKPRGTGVTTSDAERANTSPYNTYVHDGLPPGPIGAPGKAALEAAANPAEGNWKYFVTVNLDTGETLFAESFTEHQQNVRKFQTWCQGNPGKC